MTPAPQGQCEYLFTEGMNVRCTDSSPTRHCRKGNNVIDPSCWGCSTTSVEKVLDKIREVFDDQVAQGRIGFQTYPGALKVLDKLLTELRQEHEIAEMEDG